MRDLEAPPAKHVWIELIAFDVESPDLGVSNVIDDMGEAPTRLSLLLWTAEFVHSHGPDSDAMIPSECTSYGARPEAIRGPRQDWSRGKLRDLVERLRNRGIEVFFAVFDLHAFRTGGIRKTGAWNREHPEMDITRDHGALESGMLNPLKRMADGTAYAEFFGTRLQEVIEFYSFDGLHGADGYSSPRRPLWMSDFSDDMIERFHEFSGLEVPTSAPRSEWIWANARLEWINFNAACWAKFWTTVRHIVGTELKLMLNNAWTRDPFEAMYRYGTDYAALAEVGIDSMVLETSSSAVELLEVTDLPPIHGQLAALLLIKPTLPNLPLSGLTALHDTYEQWDVINTAPAMFERDLRLLTSMRSIPTGQSDSRPVLDANLFCLSDGLLPSQWQRVDELRNSCDAGPAETASGFTVLYDPNSLQQELARFCEDRVAHTHAILAELLRNGAMVQTSARAADHTAFSGPVLVIRPDLLGDDSVESIIGSHDEVVVLAAQGSASDFTGTWTLSHHRLGKQVAQWAETSPQVLTHPSSGMGSLEPETWLSELPMNMPPASLIKRAAAILGSQLGGGGQRVDLEGIGEPNAAVQVLATAPTQNTIRVTLHNTTAKFLEGSFTPAMPITQSYRLAGSNSLAMRISDGAVVTRIPPKGVAAFEITCEQPLQAAAESGQDPSGIGIATNERANSNNL